MARVRRKYPLVSFFWKLEFQERGAAHFHLVLFGLPDKSSAVLEEWRSWSRAAWYEIVGSGDRKHLVRGVTSDWVKSRRGAVGYLAKYLGKDDQTRPGDFTGRYWGKHNEAALPVADLKKHSLSDSDAVRVRRVFRGLIKSQVNEGRRAAVLKRVGWWHETGGATWMDVEAWYNKPGCDRFLPAVTPQWSGPSRLSFHNPSDDFSAPSLPFRMPSKWKARNNLSVTLYCDSAKVWGQLVRWIGIPQGALFQPVDVLGREGVELKQNQRMLDRVPASRPAQSGKAGRSPIGSRGELPLVGSREGQSPYCLSMGGETS